MASKQSGKSSDSTFLRVNFSRITSHLSTELLNLGRLIRRQWIGLTIIGLLTAVFFGPLIIRVASYNSGGDPMFNAWTLARDQNCILRHGCPNYANGNIYFPNKNSMLYSETQLSAGLLTLPLRLITANPIFANNVWTIISFFFSGFFMYLLAKWLSRGKELIPIISGLIFEFAPVKLTAIGHLQNQSIFYVPLVVLFMLLYLYRRRPGRRYLIAAFVTMILLFYASWYQMIFGLITICSILLGVLITRASNLRRIMIFFIVIGLALVTTLPLAKQYVAFSKTNKATFAVNEQVLYSSSLKDYVIPFNETLEGKLYYHYTDPEKINSYNPDSSSYHGIAFYLVALVVLVLAATRLGRETYRPHERRLIYVLIATGIIGLIVSLGPLLKLTDQYVYDITGLPNQFAVALPYILVDKFLPQLSFIRAIGRSTVIVLFALCSILALSSPLIARMSARLRYPLITVIALALCAELLPFHQYYITPNAFAQHQNIPGVYQLIRKDSSIDDIIILRSQNDYSDAPFPVARVEDVLWAGYHNKNIFNGYSGYEPPRYGSEYADFVDFHGDDIAKLKRLGLRYVLVDKQLSPHSPLLQNVKQATKKQVYSDQRYSLFKI